jgi:hypothetical protein
MEKVALGQIFLRVLWFSSVTIISLMFNVHLNTTLIRGTHRPTDRAKPKFLEINLSPLSLFHHKSLTDWAGIELGPVSLRVVTENVTFELHMTCATVCHTTEFEKFTRSIQIYCH